MVNPNMLLPLRQSWQPVNLFIDVPHPLWPQYSLNLAMVHKARVDNMAQFK